MIFHELTHILGFLYDSFQFFPGGLNNTVKRQVDSRGINRMYIITPTVVDLAKKYVDEKQPKFINAILDKVLV